MRVKEGSGFDLGEAIERHDLILAVWLSVLSILRSIFIISLQVSVNRLTMRQEAASASLRPT